jgi:selenium-binding protein 1
MAVIDADPSWPDFGEVTGWSELPNAGKELHPSAGTPAPARCATTAPRRPRPPAGAPLPDRPGICSSRTYGLDTKPGPRSPKSGSIHVGRSIE